MFLGSLECLYSLIFLAGTAGGAPWSATGTGIAPLKRMLEYALETGHDTDAGERRTLWLFLGAAWADDLPRHERFTERTAANDHFEYVPCCSRGPNLTTGTARPGTSRTPC